MSIENTGSQIFVNVIKRIGRWGLLCMLALVFWYFVIGYAASRRPDATIVSIDGEQDVFLINGEMDAGYRVDVRLQGGKETEALQVLVKLSCSEGEFQRQQNVTLHPRQVLDLKYNFHEPTVNATNIFPSVELRKQ